MTNNEFLLQIDALIKHAKDELTASDASDIVHDLQMAADNFEFALDEQECGSHDCDYAYESARDQRAGI